jgi:hypothetical protein
MPCQPTVCLLDHKHRAGCPPTPETTTRGYESMLERLLATAERARMDRAFVFTVYRDEMKTALHLSDLALTARSSAEGTLVFYGYKARLRPLIAGPSPTEVA